MTTPRKTLRVADLRDKVNYMLEASADEKKEGREAMASVLEHFLMETDNYKGFKYREVKFGDDGEVSDFGDETRRHYF